MDFQELEARLRGIETLLLSQKIVLNFDETASYTGLSKSYLYKLTSKASIPHFKPQGKHLYFNKAEVDQWLQRNHTEPINEADIEEQAATYIALHKMGGAKC